MAFTHFKGMKVFEIDLCVEEVITLVYREELKILRRRDGMYNPLIFSVLLLPTYFSSCVVLSKYLSGKYLSEIQKYYFKSP